MRKKLTRTLLAGGAVFAAACSPEQAPQPETELSATELLNASFVETLRPGDTVLAVPSTDQTANDELATQIELIDFQYPGSFEDSRAPVLSEAPVRVDAHIALHGKDPRLSNDLACDTITLDLDRFTDRHDVYLGVLALSDSTDDTVLVSWPENTEQLYVCFDDGHEPSDGVILFTSDQPR